MTHFNDINHILKNKAESTKSPHWLKQRQTAAQQTAVLRTKKLLKNFLGMWETRASESYCRGNTEGVWDGKINYI